MQGWQKFSLAFQSISGETIVKNAFGGQTAAEKSL